MSIQESMLGLVVDVFLEYFHNVIVGFDLFCHTMNNIV